VAQLWGGLPSTPHDARYPGIVRIEYPLHRSCGQQFEVLGRNHYADRWYFHIEVSRRRTVVAEWMTDPIHARHLTWGPDPICSLTSCMDLLALLRSVGCEVGTSTTSSETV
jgi:hypothetical protein